MGATVYRVTGFLLALTIFAFGSGSTILLYFAGQSAIELVYKDQWARDDLGRMTRADPSDDWYGIAFLKGWAMGFVYVLPGLTGLAASLFYNKCSAVINFTVGILILFFGSFLHTAGTMATVFYYIIFLKGLWKGQSYIGECAVIVFDEIRQDENCMQARKSLILLIAAMCTMCAGWIFLLANVMYNAITYNNVKIYNQTKKKRKKYNAIDVEDRQQSGNSRQIDTAHAQNENDTQREPSPSCSFERRDLPASASHSAETKHENPVFDAQNEDGREREPSPVSSSVRRDPSPSGTRTAETDYENLAFDAESVGGDTNAPIIAESITEKL